MSRIAYLKENMLAYETLLIDRFFNRFGPSRAEATRQVKRDDKFLASVPLTSLSIWLRLSESIT